MKRRYVYRIYPAVLLLLFMHNIIYADNRSRGFGGERAAGGSEVRSTPETRSGDIIAYSGYRNYEYYRDLERSRSSAPVKKDNSVRETSANKKIIEYTVKKGDTLFRIARNYNVSVASISELNKLGNENRIYAGMKLKIPFSDVQADTVAAGNKKITGPPSEEKRNFQFLWPLKKVDNFKRDGSENVKSIGLLITGPARAEVIASESGTVIRTGYMRGYGTYVVVSHGGRYLTVYSNLLVVSVKEGDRVNKGRVIGRISDDRTIHFQIDHAGKPQNPLEYLPGRG